MPAHPGLRVAFCAIDMIRARSKTLRAFCFALMPVGRLTEILPHLIRIIKLKGGKRLEKSDAQMKLHTGRTEINLVSPSPFLILKRSNVRKRYI